MNRVIPGQRGRLHAALHVIARRESGAPVLMRLPCKGGDALAVFSIMHAPGNFLRSRGLDEDWFARVTSPGELLSLLCGLYASVGWVALDPPARSCLPEDLHATVVERELFIVRLLHGAG